MAGLGHHIVDAGWTRLAGFLKPARSSRRHVLTFRNIPNPPVDATALARAHNLYSGAEMLSAEQFLSLDWLSCFAKSGRQLLMYHALSLLDGWKPETLPMQSLESEADRLKQLATFATYFASFLPKEQLSPLERAFEAQLKRLVEFKTRNAHEHLTKAQAILAAAHTTENNMSLLSDALRLLDLALPQLIATDGGPASHRLTDYLNWISPLLLDQDLHVLPTTRHALDRARAFLAMLLNVERNYCVEAAPVPSAEVLETPALRLATHSNVARLACNKTVAIALPAQLAGTSHLDVSAHGHALLQASLFLHDGSEDQSVTNLSHAEDNGDQLLVQGTATSSRMAFLARKGNDLRIEEQWAADNLKRWMRLDINVSAKISIARNGTQATIAIDSRNLWQLTLRGAKLLTPQDPGVLIAETRGNHVNWALKRVNRSTTKQAAPTELELPF